MTRWSASRRASKTMNFRPCGRPNGKQRNISPIPSPICSPRMLDALIVGAGPAGSAAARLLAQAGWSVALVEKSEFPRRKVCGELISAPTMPVLEACGVRQAFVAAAGPPVTHIGLYAGQTMLSSPGEQVWGRALGREHL